MIEQIQSFLKDPAKVARAATIIFFIMVAWVVWSLFTLGGELVYSGGMIDADQGRSAWVITKLTLLVLLAFSFCYASIFFAQRAKQETIVYLDKKLEGTSAQQGNSYGNTQDSFNLNALRAKIKSGSQDEKWRNGLGEICNQLNAGQGALYSVINTGKEKTLNMTSGYAVVLADGEENPSFTWGEGLIGQVASSGQAIYIDEMPEGYAARIESGLGGAIPKFLFILPIKKENEVVGVIEVATFTNISESLRKQAQEAGNILSEIS